MNRPRAGFTLVEVLLAVTVLAIIISAVYGSFATAGRSVEQAGAVREGTDLARTLLARLTTDITNAYVNTAMPETFFYGRKAQVDEKRFDSLFLTTLTNWRRPGTRESDLWEVGYTFQEEPDRNGGRTLFRKEKREPSRDVPPLEGTVDYSLTDTVADLRFRYFDGSVWTEEWDSKKQGRLPRAVEIALVLKDGRRYATTADVRNP